ncbi:MAG: PEP-CTERM sorting domain-containing protein [Planctomycetota bacterium]|jgi:hypothetical protein
MRINPDDGSNSKIIQSNYPTFNGIAYTPEPSTLLLLCLGAVMLRKRKHSLTIQPERNIIHKLKL